MMDNELEGREEEEEPATGADVVLLSGMSSPAVFAEWEGEVAVLPASDNGRLEAPPTKGTPDWWMHPSSTSATLHPDIA
ncbi:hypothetical protein Taro_021525 [Colocasia esculenta]|uniref:Uncharacterized protein n=1 Tax=Colocasia esculenta TaxID=4460 RepID=A0A843V8H2_COLES|nr:hypothetical protein [Colocasia esculenta]